jgi:hypothetical protein
MASTLNPPMSDPDLLSALTSRFEPRVQQGLICSNLQSTQDALAFLAKLQGLRDHRLYGQHAVSSTVEIQTENCRETRITLGTET